jgi:hypothetical protein
MTDFLKIGYTLSQRGLANHLSVSPSWIRRQGEMLTRHKETWARMEYSNHRCSGYKLVTREPRGRPLDNRDLLIGMINDASGSGT